VVNLPCADDSTELDANQHASEGLSGPEVVRRFEDGSTEPYVPRCVVDGPSGLEVTQRFIDGSFELEVKSQQYFAALRSFVVAL
jgi:hypothetical protein